MVDLRRKVIGIEQIRHKEGYSIKDEFEERCKFYATDKSITRIQMKNFIQACKYKFMDNAPVKWSEEEKVWRMEIIRKYLPEFVDEINDYIERETISKQKRKPIQKNDSK